jgi:hypothetical protein
VAAADNDPSALTPLRPTCVGGSICSLLFLKVSTDRPRARALCVVPFKRVLRHFAQCDEDPAIWLDDRDLSFSVTRRTCEVVDIQAIRPSGEARQEAGRREKSLVNSVIRIILALRLYCLKLDCI